MMKKRDGITLVEVLLVVAILAILTAIYIPNYLNQTKRREFDLTVEKIVAALNQARDHSASWDKSSLWGVAFGGRYKPVEASCTNAYSDQHFFAVFYDGNASPKVYNYPFDGIHRDEFSFFPLPSSVLFDTTSTWNWEPNPYCYSYIAFDPISGRLSYSENTDLGVATSSVKLIMNGNSAISSTISVSSLGFVTYTTSSDY